MEWSDERVDQIIGVLLRVGVVISALVVLAGGIWYLARFGHTIPDYRVFRGEPSELRSVPGVFRGVGAGHCRSLIQLGLLMLIATPVARVVFSIFAFAKQRDRTYVFVTVIVLSFLLYSLSGGGH